MKISLNTRRALCLLGLAALSPLSLADGVNISTPYYCSIGRSFTIAFPEPMVPESEVGKPVQADMLPVITPALPVEVEAIWDSTSTMVITLCKSMSGREIYTIEVPAGLKSVNGNPQAGAQEAFSPSHAVRMDEGDCWRNPDEPIFFSAESAKDEALVAEAVPQAYYAVRDSKTEGNDVVATLPAQVRQATVADALAHWDAYYDLAEDDIDHAEEERKALEAMDPATPLPHVWLAEPCPLDSPAEYARLMLPGLGSFNKKTLTFNDEDITCVQINSHFEVDLDSCSLNEGGYQVELRSSVPLAASCADEAFGAMKWYIYRVGRDGVERELGLLQKEGESYVPSEELLNIHPDLKDFRLTPDKEASDAHFLTRRRRTLPEVSGFHRLVFHATATPCRVYLRCEPNLPSIYGDAPDKRWEEEEVYWLRTTLASLRPRLGCSAMVSGLREGGRRQLACETRNVSKLQARVFRTSSTRADAARMLSAYRKRYAPAREEAEYRSRHREKSPEEEEDFFKADGFEAQFAETELNVETQPLVFDPSSLFPDQPAIGTYMVELIGTSAAPEWRDGCVVTQSFVQVTDLGLMWKMSDGELFAYAYRLSDASALAAGEIRMLDGEGALLGTLPLSEGIARGSLPREAEFLQVVCGEDAYTTPIADSSDEYEGFYSGYYLRALGLNPSRFPKYDLMMFSDRRVYRPGETMHLRGVLRTITGDDVSVPQVAEMRLILHTHGEQEEYVAEVGEDGAFTLSINLDGFEEDNDAYIEPRICLAGDDQQESPDQRFLLENGVDLEDEDAAELLRYNREPDYFSFVIADFKRNEFEIQGELKAEGDTVSMGATATAFTGVPVAEGDVNWTMQQRGVNIFPEAFPDFCFGDFRDGASGYYGFGAAWNELNRYESSQGKLDASGAGKVSFTLPELSFPSRSRVRVTASITNGAGQTLRCTRSTMVESSAVYSGIRVGCRLSQQGTAIPMDAVLIQSDESPYAGPAIPCEVTVCRRVFRSYRYGTKSMSAVHNVPEESEVYQGQLAVGGTPTHLDIPTSGPGIYDIELRGKDANGKPFVTAVRQYVWGGSDVSPWEYLSGEGLALTADKDSYKPGDTARILVQTPVDAELLITMERGGVHRVLRRSVTVDKPVIEIPIEAQDGPVCYLSVFLVQKEQGRAVSGLPVIKTAELKLDVDVPEKHLSLEFDLPSAPARVREEWTVGGRVLGADGKPVAGASLALYAVDEGTLQVTGYDLPDGYRHFYSERPCGVTSFSTSGQMLGDQLSSHDFGNKGMYIGGGGDEKEDGADGLMVRENFEPCALWLGNVRTDAEGRFSATYANPDTLTRYRLMAVADAGDRFGSAQSSYKVVQPVMLEAAAPAAVAVGDKVDLPVTVSMLPDALPESVRGKAEWTVSLSAEHASVPECSRTITLNGSAPQTVTFPVQFDEKGEGRLTWSVRSSQPELAGMADAVAFSFRAEPTAPKLRERFTAVLEPGASVSPAAWVKGNFSEDAQMQYTLSPCPLVGAGAGTSLLLSYPHSCVEQTSSKMLPWLFRTELENALGIRFPQGADTKARIKEFYDSIMSRQREDGRFAYWAKSDPPSEFSAYALLALSYAEEQAKKDGGAADVRISQSRRRMLRELREDPDSSLVGLLALARFRDGLTLDDLKSALEKRSGFSPAELWLLASVVSLMECPSEAEQIASQIPEMAENKEDGWNMPPVDTAELLFAIIRRPGDEATGEALHQYIGNGVEQGRFNSTWEAGWLCILVHEYLQRQGSIGTEPEATANGEPVSMESPLRASLNLGAALPLLVEGGKLYASGQVEGYQAEDQARAIVDNGFRVERRYEKLMPDGSWQPTGTFTVGDVVRITLTTYGSSSEPCRYFVLEDRVPSAFEVVNPALASQGLPPGLMQQRSSAWRWPGYVNHVVYGRDSVSFYATSWSNHSAGVEISYVARVVRSGEVSAPGARAELMYRPQVYGLSIPQTLTVEPRP